MLSYVACSLERWTASEQSTAFLSTCTSALWKQARRTDGHSRGSHILEPTYNPSSPSVGQCPPCLGQTPSLPHVQLGVRVLLSRQHPKPPCCHPTFFLSSRLVSLPLRKVVAEQSISSLCRLLSSSPYTTHSRSSYERHRPPQLRQSSRSTTQHRQSSTPHQLYITSPTRCQTLLLLFPPTQHRPHVLNNHGASFRRRRLCVARSRRPV